MAYENILFDWSFINTGATLVKFTIVKADTAANNSVVVNAAATTWPVGIAQDTPATGAIAQVRVLGISKVLAGGTIAAGDRLTSDSAGKAIATTTAGNVIVGTALTAGVANDVISVLLTGPSKI